MNLYIFFKDPKNFVAREKLIHMRAAYEMKLYAAQSGVQLHMTEPEIDNLGYDFVAAKDHNLLYIQNKSKLSDAATVSWDIHVRHLSVPFQERDLAPEVNGVVVGGLEGGMGGVLLHVIDADAAKNNQLMISYYYFDVFYASAVANGLWKAEGFSSLQAIDLLTKIGNGELHERISLPFYAMLPIKSPNAIIHFRFHLPEPSNYISVGRLPARKLGDEESLRLFSQIWSHDVKYWSSLD
jgi:hypothetical protein